MAARRIHALICNLPRVNSVAVGIAMMLFGMGLANYLGKPYDPAERPAVASVWTWLIGRRSSRSRSALRINALFVVGVVLAPLLAWMLKNTRWGMILRLAGESEEAAAAMGYSVNRIRIIATAIGGGLAGIGGSYLSLVLPGLVDRADLVRAGPDGRRPGDLRPMGPGALPVGVALVRRRRLARRGPAGAEPGRPEPCVLWNTAPYILTLVHHDLTSSRSAHDRRDWSGASRTKLSS